MTIFSAPDGTTVEEARMLKDGETIPQSFQRQLQNILRQANPEFMTSYLLVLGGQPGFVDDDGPQNAVMIAAGSAEQVHALWESAHTQIEAMAAIEQAEAEQRRYNAAASALDEVPTSMLEQALAHRRAMARVSQRSFSLEDLAERFGLRLIRFDGNTPA